MRLTVLGGSGAWPTATQACSGYLIEYDGFRLLVDPGYATLPRLLERIAVDAVDAVLVSHGHPDHCADLSPLLRARAMHGTALPPLPVYAPHGAVDAVLALDRPGMLDDAHALGEFSPGDRFDVGPFTVCTWLLPHSVTNAGLRIGTPDAVLAYTGDTGPSSAIVQLADGADLLLSDATHLRDVPAPHTGHLLTARLAGQYAAHAGAARLMLTHLWPGTDPAAAREAAAETFAGPVSVAATGLVTDIGYDD